MADVRELNLQFSHIVQYLKLTLFEQFHVGGDPIIGYIRHKSSHFKVKIQDFEVLNRRNSRKRKCNEYSDYYGTMILQEHLLRKSCRPLYLSQDESFPLCNTMEKMKNSSFHYEEPEEMGIKGPCRRISKIRMTSYKGKDSYDKTKEWYLSIFYPKEFKIITQSKEVDIHSLIGNIGGYIGLFMGKIHILSHES